MNEINENVQLGDLFQTMKMPARSEKSGNSLSLSVWGGRLFFTVFGKTKSGNLFHKSIDFSQLMVLDSALNDLIRMPAESVQHLTFNRYDRELRKKVPDFQLNLIKDQRQVYILELKGLDNQSNGFSDRFSEFLDQDIVIRNAEPFKPAESSSYSIKKLQLFFKLVCPIEMSLTGRKNTPTAKSDYSNGGGRGFNNYKGKPREAAAPAQEAGNAMPNFEDGTVADSTSDDGMSF